jgi:penicillin-binding protein 1C
MPAPVAHLLTDILADDTARAPAFGMGGPLDTDYPAAVKTGTSTDFTDNWTVGFTRRITVAVWAGNFDGAPMQGVSGVSGAAPIWRQVMDALRDRYPPEPFPTAGLTRRSIALQGGQYAEWFITEGRVAPDPQADRLQVIFPAEGDLFGADIDSPAEFSRLRLRARAPRTVSSLVFEIDGRAHPPVSRPFEQWWSLQPGAHQVRVWPADAPDAASPLVRFRVDAAP